MPGPGDRGGSSLRRLLVCSWIPHSPIQAVDLADSTVVTVRETSLDYLDGLTRDRQGRIYVSVSSAGRIVRFDGTFSAPPEQISSGHASPADIYIRRDVEILAVPNFTAHTVDLLPLRRAQEAAGEDGRTGP